MKLAILGSVGVPGRYGGFETLADNLVQYHSRRAAQCSDMGVVTVYCSAQAYPQRSSSYLSAELRYSRFKANGAQSVIYDIVTALDAVRRGHRELLFLGVSGAVVVPLIRLIAPRCWIVTNVDGIEWKREKWSGLAKAFLRLSEALAVRWSHVVVADNQAIAEHILESYGADCDIIPYGGDHAVLPVSASPNVDMLSRLPESYAFGLCRIEPENNVEMILEAFSETTAPLVFVGNWDNSEFGRSLKARFNDQPNVWLLDPVYDPATLQALRRRATVYVHGHSAGGTNPALVEMMHFGIPVYAFDCSFNRHTTQNAAVYFGSKSDLAKNIEADDGMAGESGLKMREIAQANYTWSLVSERYFDLMSRPSRPRSMDK
ncbi:DUF1972 domain-containing protein [Roseibacterium sp. SDUM158016]|uniref:DUF1972 domain-containing protein n=1 Tax=Roseicyclus sediminis TaxID=2980997 RepID=UPI0021CE3DBC|nr:DUF1972 domain-containing protein [Roseibacterium sp. SDUM158016]MCU4653763.1 DUF1972 domain-containing protein [Roseibacterium sp. SDUM158016]